MCEELVSVIIPVYQAEPYLKQCVDTVLHQTHRNLEVILVDDGSPDNCPKLCDEYALLDQRVKVIHKLNGGVSSARNTGLDAAKGAFISFVDSDDWIDCDFLESLLRAIKSNAADVSVCGIIKVYPEHYKTRLFYESDRVLTGEEPEREILKNDQMSSHLINKLFKRSLFDDIRFPEGKNYEDIFVMHRVFAAAKTVAVLKDVKYYYRQREGSIVNTPSVRNLADQFSAHHLRYTEGTAKYADLRPCLVKNLAGAAFDLLEGGKWEADYAAEFERARNFLRELRHNHAALRQLGPYLKLKVRYPLLRRWVRPVLKLYHKLAPRRQAVREPDWRALSAKNANILLGAPEYGNLGDVAIAEAEKQFFKSEGKALVEVTEEQVRAFKGKIRRAIGPSALIALNGGGNMGSQYKDQEEIRSWAIRSFRNNKIVLFPQTVYFSDTPAADKLKKALVKRYGKHANLTLFARELRSYAILKSLYGNRVELSPDIAMALAPYEYEGERSGALLILRNDVEANLKIDQYYAIKNTLILSGHPVEVCDTVQTHGVPLKNRETELNAFLNKIASAKLVVTDRLHAMIFAAITGTPCIAFDNYSQKLSGSYQWLKELAYLKFCGSAGEFDQALRSLDLSAKYSYRNNGLEEKFEALRRAVRREDGPRNP